MISGSDINLKIGATDKTGTAFRSAEQKMKSFAGSAKGVMGALGIGLGSAAVISGLKKVTSSAFDYAESISDASVATQTTAEQIQVFRYMARQAGASAEQLDGALRRMNDSAVKGAKGSGEQAEALKTLGINSDAFFRMSTAQRWESLGKSIASAKDKNVALSSSMKLLGESAPLLMQSLIDLGSKGYAGALKNVSDAGQLMNDKMTKDLTAAKKQMEDFKNSVSVNLGGPLAIAATKAVSFAQSDESIASGVYRKLQDRQSSGSSDDGDGSFADWLMKKLSGRSGAGSPADDVIGRPFTFPVGPNPYEPKPEVQNKLSAAVPDIFQDSKGVWRNTPEGSGDDLLKAALAKTAEVNKETARLLTVAANEAAAANAAAARVLAISKSERK